ncbi:hypothetical protein Ddye_020390 [Dipteronia dyeriana]|uniref:DNA helicase Pif1-like 2B domain-containing protein n=1 Tax=Dipteronia dyeriana TaxID=168575 RepID=A0AAD9WX03_9ROSI|nr:hypothetical protein Ddye_020390 [Dipteronia dyeriana]
MSEDYHRSDLNFFNSQLKVLKYIHFVVDLMNNNINDYHLVDYDIIFNEDEQCIREINDELDDISLKALIDVVFPNLNDYLKNIDAMTNRAILTPKYDYVDDINSLLIEQFLGEAITYCNFDETIDKNEQAIREDFLNSFTPSGFPPHQLVLKENCLIILLRNIYPSEGLCNDRRLIYRRFSPNLIDAHIVNGHYQGKHVFFLPRIPFIPIEGEKNGFSFKRTQYPIKLSFAMTINKAQGQTLDYIGIYFTRTCILSWSTI